MEFENDMVDEQSDVEIGVEEQNEPKQLPIAVYVKVNDQGYITDVNSNIFIDNLEGWTKFDEGYGDKYAHAQSQYFDTPLTDEKGNYMIKFQ